MSRKIPANADGFTPVITSMVKELGIMPALVFGIIWEKCGLADGVCWESQKNLSRDTGISISTFKRCAEKLIETGYIEKQNNGMGRTVTYRDTGKALLESSVTARVRQSDVGQIELGKAKLAHTELGVAQRELGVGQDELGVSSHRATRRYIKRYNRRYIKRVLTELKNLKFGIPEESIIPEKESSPEKISDVVVSTPATKKQANPYKDDPNYIAGWRRNADDTGWVLPGKDLLHEPKSKKR